MSETGDRRGRRWRSVLLRVGPGLAIVAGCFLYIRLAYGPFGTDLPSAPPVEANRVEHPLGFSLVLP